MKVSYHRISDVDIDVSTMQMEDADLDVLRDDPLIAEHNYSFTTLRAHDDGKLYLGMTHMGNRILWCFDPADQSFEDLDYPRIADEFDIKIHRSLEYDRARDVFYGVSLGCMMAILATSIL